MIDVSKQPKYIQRAYENYVFNTNAAGLVWLEKTIPYLKMMRSMRRRSNSTK